MGMILFLILACGLPGLMLLYIRQRVPDNVGAGFAAAPPTLLAPPVPSERHTGYLAGYLGGSKAEGSANQNSRESLSVHGADIGQGLTSNTLGTDAKEQGSKGVA